MTDPSAERITIALDSERRVSGLVLAPAHARACFVFAHGAGAGMEHPFMTAVAAELSRLGIATVRYQFPYMERRSKRPDPPELCHATVRAAVAEAAHSLPSLPLFAGGKSFGGRMTSQAQAVAPLAGVRGLAFLGFPLHPAGRASSERGRHLADVHVPMLFLQGTRDELASCELLEPLVAALGERASLKLIADADHSFNVPARTGRRDDDVRTELLQTLVEWIDIIAHADREQRHVR